MSNKTSWSNRDDAVALWISLRKNNGTNSDVDASTSHENPTKRSSILSLLGQREHIGSTNHIYNGLVTSGAW